MTTAVTSPRPAPQVFMPVIAGTVLIALALPIFLVAGWPLDGWVIAAGGGSDSAEIPTALDNSLDDGDTVKITLGSGATSYFSKIAGKTWEGDGIVSKAGDGTWTYVTSEGSTYTFDSSGKPTGCRRRSDGPR